MQNIFWTSIKKHLFLGTRSREASADYRLHFYRRKLSPCIQTYLGPERVYCQRQLRSAPGRWWAKAQPQLKPIGALGRWAPCRRPGCEDLVLNPFWLHVLVLFCLLQITCRVSYLGWPRGRPRFRTRGVPHPPLQRHFSGPPPDRPGRGPFGAE